MASDPGCPDTQHLSVSEVEAALAIEVPSHDSPAHAELGLVQDLYNAALADVQAAGTAEQRKERGQRLAALSKVSRRGEQTMHSTLEGFPNNVLRARLNSGHAALMLPCTVCLAHVVIELEKACVHMSLGLEKACVHTFWGLQRASCPQESGSHPAGCPHSRRVDMGI